MSFVAEKHYGSCVSEQCRYGYSRLLPEEKSVLHAAGESWESVKHQSGKRLTRPHPNGRLRERTQPAPGAGPHLRGRHRPQRRG